MIRRPHLLAGAALASGLIALPVAHATGPGPRSVPPFPAVGLTLPAGKVARGRYDNANPIDNPITGASIGGIVVGAHAPPSLSELQEARPGSVHRKTIKPMRRNALRQAALGYGAQGGLAAESYAINLMLVRDRTRLDQVFDFRKMLLPLGNGQTLLRPPIVTEAEMAFALRPGGQVAKQTDHVYQITEQAQLASAAPDWRTYLVRTWNRPVAPPRDLLPRTETEIAYWKRWVADGWALGEQQAVQIFLDDLSRMEKDYVGMARYQVLLRAGVVESPDIAFHDVTVSGGRDRMLVGSQTVRITDQPGLNPDRAQWRGTGPPPGGPIGAPPVR